MKKKRAIFRADANSKIGFGHISRITAIAESLKSTFDIVFLVQEPTEYLKHLITNAGYDLIQLPATDNYLEEAQNISDYHLEKDDVIICDGYFFETQYQKILKESGARLVYIDDLNTFEIEADLLINHSPGAKAKDYKLQIGAKALCGLDYLLLRTPFLKAAQTNRSITSIKNTLICIGGADPLNFTTRLTNIFIEIDNIENLTVITGDAFSHKTELQDVCQSSERQINWITNLTADEMVAEIKRNQLAVVPASTISLECVAVGVGIIAGYYVDNQKNIYDGLISNRLAFDGGNFNTLDSNILKKNIIDIISSIDNIKEQITRQKQAVDGYSMQRITEHINNL